MGMQGSTLPQWVRELPSLDLRPNVTEGFGKNSDLAFNSETAESASQQCHNHLANLINICQYWKTEYSQIQYDYWLLQLNAIEKQPCNTMYCNPSNTMYWFYYLTYMQTCKNIFKLHLTENIIHFQRYVCLYGSTIVISKENHSTGLKCF